ncbi:MAG TPA: helix-hairpin-helix domain-containing protein [Patescibacteria group bacterium]|nr:helix-hairpin-helix domain-containing protein [Patescibacteria group bacterium]
MPSHGDIKERVLIFITAFRSELLLGCISVFIVVISLVISFALFKKNDDAIQFNQSQKQITVDSDKDAAPRIFIDIQGAVEKPDVYEVTMGARLKDVLVLADGLSVHADREYFTRTFNLAKKVVDQEKIYIPSEDEVIERPITDGKTSTGLIGINTASIDLLETLPGIGAVTAQKIIDKRLYSSLEELLNKKAVSQSVFSKIKNLVSTE